MHIKSQGERGLQKYGLTEEMMGERKQGALHKERCIERYLVDIVHYDIEGVLSRESSDGPRDMEIEGELPPCPHHPDPFYLLFGGCTREGGSEHGHRVALGRDTFGHFMQVDFGAAGFGVFDVPPVYKENAIHALFTP